VSEAPTWLAVHEEGGEVRFRVGTAGPDHVVAEWPGLAELVATRDARHHRLSFAEGVSEAERRKLERGAARILLWQLEGKLALHGAAVAIDGDALLVLGGSGSGKSTLAAALCGSGGELVADDAIAVQEGDPPRVLPTETDHWLDEGARQALGLAGTPARRDKAAIVASMPAPAPRRIAHIVTLEWGHDTGVTGIETLRGTAAMAAMLPHVVRFVLDDPATQRRELDALHAIVARVPVHVVRRERSFAALGEAVDALRALCFMRGRER
jgi:hypothetical protein